MPSHRKEIFQERRPPNLGNVHLIFQVASIRRFCPFDLPREVFDFRFELRLLILEKLFPRPRVHKISERISILQSVPALGEEVSGFEEILPVDPGAQSGHDLLIDSEFQFF